MMLPDEDEYDVVNVLIAVALAVGLLGVFSQSIARGDEPRRRISLEEPAQVVGVRSAPAPVVEAPKRKPAVSPKSAARSQGTASAPRKGGVPADSRPLVIVHTVPRQCAPCRDFDRWAEQHAARSPFRFQAREYASFDDLPSRVGTVPQFDFQGSDGRRHSVNGWTGKLAPITAEFMRHNPDWTPGGGK
jgi:hypothetical protein